jgi:3-dehydroquinate synthase
VRHEIPSTEEGKNWEVFSDVCASLLKAFPDAGSESRSSSCWVAEWSETWVGLRRRYSGGAFLLCRSRPRCWRRSTQALAGKVAVNFGGVKNIMGAISQPSLVVCDLSTLDTLSARELRSGTAEIIKYGAVCSSSLFEQLERGDLEKILARDQNALVDIVTQSVALKARVVEQDEFDKKGIRNVLNFGHTIGHGLELSAGLRTHPWRSDFLSE